MAAPPPPPSSTLTAAYAHPPLPPLPVPPLEKTLARWLDSLAPPLSDAAIAEAKDAVEACLACEDVRAAQARLEERAVSEPSWLDDWWLTGAYTSWPSPTPYLSNYFIGYPAEALPEALRGSQAAASAYMAAGFVAFFAKLAAGRIPREYMGRKPRIPLSMHQYAALWGTTRIPGEAGDSLLASRHAGDLQLPVKALVISPAGYFIVTLAPALSEDCPVDMAALAATLEALARLPPVDELDASARILGELSAGERPNWAQARTLLLEHEPAINGPALDAIADTALAIVLDPHEPDSTLDATRTAAGGDASLRMFDKTIQIIAYGNGIIGVNGEHSPADAISTVYVFNDIHTAEPPPALLHWLATPSHAPRKTNVTLAVAPVRLAVPRQALAPVLVAARTSFATASEDFDEDLLFYNTFGHDALKAGRTSPDAFIQMAIGLAYFRLHGKHAVTYETGQTRQFALGRTETVRAASSERAAFIEAMGAPDATVTEKRAALDAAIKRHLALLKDACFGAGVDRHLLGLRMACSELGLPLPELFSTEAFITSSQWVISSSNTNPAPFPRIGGFGPVVHPHGYGICYSTLPDMICVNITSWRSSEETSSAAMRKALAGAFTDVGALVVNVPKL
ncbi:carnitine O-acetyltransferase [Thecamonas trahens ATCC 50062]|uniref:Carnitine O-acetyltransferase n=1 Tax=Thecamonas trahens ATCC 50062 TaxID=461836 RepID=A0A0L0D5Y9_THETB|nr:carnitine O-acetyltransferase [Thecamonas trahens ATCC 50062]KNC47595.1 carnitine O-acetyltransferase [Thecamonas trahens ATCC 50062]|eukprot:XP_013759524.1 carnitine O-acetyltransferase [Thecamonas trahens ATCC 50062]